VIALVFSYEVEDAAEFERVYGTDGEWAEFFRQGRGYIGTELLRDVEAWAGSVAGEADDARPEDRAPLARAGRYLVLDRWESADAYNAFVAAHREEYMERVDATRFLYDSELRFGTFETLS
jgi:heme-degrading monooxygenase HmoA